MGNNCYKLLFPSSKPRPKTSPLSIPYSTENDASSRPSLAALPIDMNIDKLVSSPVQQKPLQHSKLPMIENSTVVWLTLNITDDQDAINQVHHLFRSFQVFTDIDDFFAFIVQLTDEQLFLILSDQLAQKLLSFIHKISQIIAIYIIAVDRPNDEQWIKQYPKIQGIFTHIQPLCDQLQSKLYLSEYDSIPIEILDTSSMISRYLIKQILLNDITYNEKSKQDFIRFARQEYPHEFNAIDEFEENYTPSKAIWWCTRKSFLHIALHRASRTQNLKHLIRLGFLIRDLHQQIDELHTNIDDRHSQIVYRGQGILKTDFKRIKAAQDQFLSFNNFLWTDTDRQAPLTAARLARNHPDFYGILFRIEISPSIKSMALEKLSYYRDSSTQNFFSIFSLFRLGDMKQIEDHIWEVDLISIDEDDQQLKDFLQSIDDIEGENAWEQLGCHFIQTKQFNRAEELYRALLRLHVIRDSQQLASLYEQLGSVYHKQNDSINAMRYYKKSLKTYLTFLSPNDSSLVLIYLSIGNLLREEKHISEAIKNIRCALNISLHSTEYDYLQIAALHYYLAEIYDEEGILVEAIQHYQSALEHELSHSPPQHHSIAKNYNKIGETFYRLKDYTTAMSYYEKTLEIQKKSLSPNHTMLAITNYNMAKVLDKQKQQKEAVEYASRAVNIARHTFGSRHDDVRFYEKYLNQLRQKASVGVVPNGAVYE